MSAGRKMVVKGGRDAVIFNRDAARRVATKTTRADMTMREITTGKGGVRLGSAHMGGKWAGESSRKPRRPRPYSRAFAGISLRSASRPKAAHWCRHAHTMPTPHASHLWDPMVFTTTRHAASLRSSNNCKCLIEMFFIARGESPLHKRLTPYGPFSAVPLLEYGGLNLIPPSLRRT